jgi:hypothetical protein
VTPRPANEAALTVAEFHDIRQGRGYLLALDTTISWGDEGPHLITTVTDHTTGTVEASTSHIVSAFAQRWLVEHGCPAGDLAMLVCVGNGRLRPADPGTRRLEDQIRASGGRYAITASHHEIADGISDAWVIAHDTTAQSRPVRVFHQVEDLDTRTYVLREGAFPTPAAARAWLRHRDTPLPGPLPRNRHQDRTPPGAGPPRRPGRHHPPDQRPPVASRRDSRTGSERVRGVGARHARRDPRMAAGRDVGRSHRGLEPHTRLPGAGLTHRCSGHPLEHRPTTAGEPVRKTLRAAVIGLG